MPSTVAWKRAARSAVAAAGAARPRTRARASAAGRRRMVVSFVGNLRVGSGLWRRQSHRSGGPASRRLTGRIPSDIRPESGLMFLEPGSSLDAEGQHGTRLEAGAAAPERDRSALRRACGDRRRRHALACRRLVKIIAGPGSSGIARQLGPLAAQNNVLYIAGPAAADAITGLNRNTFRAGRQTLQDVLDAANIFPPKSTGKKIVVFAEDTAFGAGNAAAVQLVFGGKGHTVSKILSPFGAADLTPYAQQLKNSGADAAFVAWANTNNSAAMWQALQQQGVPQKMDIITGLANRESYDALGPLVQGITLISHYVYTAPKNTVNTWMTKWLAKNHLGVPNIFTPDGFVAAQMICRA